MSPHDAALAARRAELERRLAALSPQQRVQLDAAAAQVTAAGAIPRRAPEDPVPMSFGQELLWMLEQASPGMHGYNVPRTARLQGPLHLQALRDALNALVVRHEILRTTFSVVDGEPRQVVHAPREVPFEVIDLEEIPRHQRVTVATERVRALARRPFDLEHDLQLRATVLRVASDDHVLLIESHHVASDAWSRNILLRELGVLYAAVRDGQPADLAPLPVQYGDFAIWQRRELSGLNLDRLLTYWRRTLQDLPPALALPTDRPRVGAPSFDGDVVTRTLPLEQLAALKALSESMGVTLFMILLAAFDVLLARYSAQDDIVVGSPIAGRAHPDTEGMIGYLANTLVLRTHIDAAAPFSGLVAQVRETALGAYDHQELPYEKLVGEIYAHQGGTRASLFQAMFTLQDAELRTIRLDGTTFVPFGADRGATKCDVTMFAQERVNGLRFGIEYRTALFDRATIERMLGAYTAILEHVTRAPETAVAAIPLVSAAEREECLRVSRGRMSALEDVSVADLVARQATLTPAAIAVESDESDERLTYGELLARADLLARWLIGAGVRPGVGVGICADRSPELMVALLATLRAGGHYVPLDPDSPPDRLAYMLRDADVKVVLTLERNRGTIPDGVAKILSLDTEWAGVERWLYSPPPPRPSATDLAYVIYTSGSTGRPKGVMVRQRSVVNYLRWMQRAFGVSAADAILQKAPVTFDASVWELFLPLISGARLVLARPGGHQDPSYLVDVIARRRVSVAQLVPSQLQMLLELPLAPLGAALGALRHLFLGGEALPAELLRRLLRMTRAPAVTNLYGPTEATVYATAWTVDPATWDGETVLIGTAIENTNVYVLDAGGNPVPSGVAGEICIGGVAVAAGYLQRPELTAERFVADPYAPGTMYRTGDAARRTLDGRLEYLGRVDTQVKLRGFRIELGEIESVIASHEDAASAAVVVREDTPGDQRLVAYVVPNRGADRQMLAGRLAEHASRVLPEYMLPTAFVWMEHWPLSANGKLDRRALPAPVDAVLPVIGEARQPRTRTEHGVLEIWESVLGRSGFGVTDDFFALGGHSLLALRVAGRVLDRFDRRVTLRDFFEAPTVEALARVIDRAASRSSPRSTRIPRTASNRGPLTQTQELLWLLQRTTPGLIAYNVAEQWRLTGPIDVAALQHALAAVTARHDILRTRFIAGPSGPEQIIGDDVAPELEIVDLTRHLPRERQAAADRVVAARAGAPFELSTDLLIRATLVRLSAEEHLLVIALHHIAYDGWSRGVLVRDLSTAYTDALAGGATSLPPLPIRFLDYACWQRETLSSAHVREQLQYWCDHLAGIPPVLALPTQHARPVVPRFEGGREVATFPPTLLEALKRLASQSDATLFMVLLAAFQTLLHRLGQQDDIVVGTVVAGRDRPELEGLIGCFTNTLPLRVSFGDDPVFRDVIGRVREAHLGAVEHGDVAFESIVSEVQSRRGENLPSLAQVLFVLQNAGVERLRFGEATVRGAEVRNVTAKVDLSISLSERADGLRAVLEYRADLFDAATVQRVLASFGMLLDGIVANPDCSVSRVPVLTQAERAQLLEWGKGPVVPQLDTDATITSLIRARAAALPDVIAVEEDGPGGRTLTYREMVVAMENAAAGLRALGVRRGHTVAVCAERSLETTVALLGVLAAGAAYVPVSVDFPSARIRFVLDDAGVAMVLAQPEQFGALAAAVDSTGTQLVSVASLYDPTGAVTRHESSDPESDGVAYVMYTSGSTGSPKGVAIEHHSVVNHALWMQQHFPLAPGEAVLQTAALTFDPSVADIFGTLIGGGRILIARPGGQRDPRYLADVLTRRHIGSWQAVPSVARLVLQELGTRAGRSSVRHMYLGGEAAPPDVVARAYELLPDVTVHNGYGPTETTIDAVWHTTSRAAVAGLVAAGAVPIGRPVGGATAYIVDAGGALAPAGTAGELWIGGAGVGRGYLGRSELTRERFMRDPFGDDGRVYRTGDRARWRADGEMEFLGRIDDQVKVRGVRIELGEIEAVLMQTGGVNACAAVLREDTPGDPRIVAYVVATPGSGVDSAMLRSACRRVLPEAMVPAAIVMLDALPTLASAKVDRRALVAMATPEHSVGEGVRYAPPRTTIEHELVQIWESLLAVRPISIDADFFEIGGHSLLAVQMLYEIERVRGRRLPLASLFEARTVEQIAGLIEAAVHDDGEPPYIVLNAEGRGQPIVFVHGDVRGGGWYVRKLAPLVSADSPMIVLPTLRSDGPSPATTIEAMAALHLRDLQSVQPQGPYFLAGFCIGGLVAFEMARQLTARGETVERVVLIDTGASNARLRALVPFVKLSARGGSAAERLTRRAALLQRLRYYHARMRHVRRMPTSRKLEWLRGNVRRRLPDWTGSAPDPGVVDSADAWGAKAEFLARPGTELIRFRERAASVYVPARYPGRVDLIWATELVPRRARDRTRGWECVSPSVTTCIIESTHVGMITQAVPELAAAIRAAFGFGHEGEESEASGS